MLRSADDGATAHTARAAVIPPSTHFFRLRFMNAVLFGINNGLLLLISVRLAGCFFRQHRRSIQFLAAVMVFDLVGSQLMLLSGLAGLVHYPGIVTGVLLLLVSAAELLLRPPSSNPPSRPSETLKYSWVDGLVTTATGGISAFWLLRFVLSARVIGYDSYHAATLGRWLQAGDIHTTGFAQAYFPMNAELLSLWFMAPLMHDGATGLVGLINGLLLATAAYSGLRLLAVERWLAGMATLFILASPVVLVSAATISAVDIAAPAWLLAGLVMLCAGSIDNGPTKVNRANLVLGILGAGMAAGTKANVAHLATAIVLVGLIKLWRAADSKGQRLALFGLALSGLAGEGFWYLRNLALTSQPLPVPRLPAGTLQSTSIFAFLERYPDFDHWMSAVRVLTNWPFSFFLAATIGVVVTAFQMIRRWPSWKGAQALTYWLAAISFVAAVGHPLTPFSAGATSNLENGTIHPLGARYVILVFVCGVMLFVLAIHRSRWSTRVKHGVGTLLVGLIIVELAHALRSTANVGVFQMEPWVPVGAIACGGAGWVVWRLASTSHLIRLAPHLISRHLRITAVAVAVIAAFWAPAKILQSDQVELRRPRTGWVVARLEELPGGSRVAGRIVSNRGAMLYRTLGRHYQHEVVDIHKDGTRLLPKHLGPRVMADRNDFVDNLATSGVEYIVVLRGDDDAWPTEQLKLSRSRLSTAIAESPSATIWLIQVH